MWIFQLILLEYFDLTIPSLIFLGKGFDMCRDYKNSLVAYRKAVKVDPGNALGYKGLLVLSHSSKDVEVLLEATQGLISLSEKSSNMVEAVDYVESVRKFVYQNFNESNELAYLKFISPESPIFEYMEGRLPRPSSTYAKIIKIYENHEAKILAKLQNQPLRISGLTKNESDKEKYKVYSKSALPFYYSQLLSWSEDDQERRHFEAKLLHYIYNTLIVAPEDSKADLLSKVKDLASGAVLLKTNDPFAWNLELELNDVAHFKDFEYLDLTKYVELFPDEPLAKVLYAFLNSDMSPFKQLEFKKESDGSDEPEEIKEEKKEVNELTESADSVEMLSQAMILEYMNDGYTADPNSILISRILGSYYIKLREYETAVDIATKGIKLVKNREMSLGISIPNATIHFMSILGYAYVFYQAPKNYSLALSLFDKILSEKSDYTDAKIGKGLIYREQAKYNEAEQYLKAAYLENTDNSIVLFEYAWCQILLKEYDEGREGLNAALEKIKGGDLLSHDYRAQIWWRIGQSYWLQHALEEKLDEETISLILHAFTSSLEENPNFAPTFTSLGKLYSIALKDMERATKSFYRAFELDGGEVEAAEYLASEFADGMQWDLVQVVATRVIESEHVRLSSGKELSWPYRALGIASLNTHNYAKAVTCYQAALRITNTDSGSWDGLGEAYSYSGRYVSASKAFMKAISLDPNNWIAKYHLGNVQKLTNDFQSAITTFKEVITTHPNESVVKFSLIETILLAAKHELRKEVFSQAALFCQTCIKVAHTFIEQGLTLTQDLWMVIGQCCEIFLTVKSSLPDAPIDILLKLANNHESSVLANDDMKVVTEIDDITMVSLKDLNDKRENTEDIAEKIAHNTSLLHQLYIFFMKLSFVFARKDKNTRYLAFYNLGLSELWVHLDMGSGDSSNYLLSSIDCFKRVIRQQGQNPDIWNSYGIACSFLNAKVAQHCFIRSLVLNSKQPITWNNLATLYLQKSDLELSEAAIGKSLMIDPDFVPAWVGQGVVAYTMGNISEAHKNFEHSYAISNGMNKLSKLYYSLSIFEQLKLGKNKVELSHKLESSVLSLQKYLLLSPESPLALNLLGLILERNKDYKYSFAQVETLCDSLEKEYDQSESLDVLVKYAKSKAHLARVSLGAHLYDQAIEHAQAASGVSEEYALEEDEIAKELKKCRLSAFLTSGLGYYFLGEYGESISSFKRALIESEEDQDVIVLLAQVLWAHGGENEKEVALEQLFSSIEKNGASIKIALTLGAIGVTHDETLIEPADDELTSISVERLSVEDPDNFVPRMLSAMQQSLGNDPKSPWYRAAFTNPWDFDAWRHVDPETALKIAKSTNNVTSTDLSDIYVAARSSKSDMAKAVFFAPWNENSWAGLAESIA